MARQGWSTLVRETEQVGTAKNIDTDSKGDRDCREGEGSGGRGSQGGRGTTSS